jgi:Aerobic-type carbon monoxide dehydrogenase, middle subunit CoxM/CutM homologs
VVTAYTAKTLPEALELCKNERLIPFAGGTDLMVRRRSWSGTHSHFEYPALFIGGLTELQWIHCKADTLIIGSAATLATILENQDVPQILKEALSVMASPAIRNVATLGGNICNASPAGDTLPPLHALEAALVIQNSAGSRELPVADFIKGPGQTDLKAEELLTEIHIPLKRFNCQYYKKVGTRKADALSKVSFAGLAEVSGGVVADIRIALGAVAPRVVRDLAAEAFLKGKKTIDLPKLIPEFKQFYSGQIRPIDDQRSNAAYRSEISYRLIEYFITQLK